MSTWFICIKYFAYENLQNLLFCKYEIFECSISFFDDSNITMKALCKKRCNLIFLYFDIDDNSFDFSEYIFGIEYFIIITVEPFYMGIKIE